MLKPADLNKKDLSELKVLAKELVEERFKLSLQAKLGQLEKTHRLPEIRRDIARVKTLLRQRQEEKTHG